MAIWWKFHKYLKNCAECPENWKGLLLKLITKKVKISRKFAENSNYVKKNYVTINKDFWVKKYDILGKESQQHLSLKRREFGKDETDGQSIILNISKTSKIFISSQLLSFISDGWMFTSTVRTQRATTLMLSRPRIASCSFAANRGLAALSKKI